MLALDRSINLLADESWVKLLNTPRLVLNYDYADVVFFTLLAYIKNPCAVLDLGSFTGMLPFFVERLSNETCQFDWTLVDDSRYLNELKNSIINNQLLSGKGLKAVHKASWLKNKIPTGMQGIFESHSDYLIPPVTPDDFEKFWKSFSALAKIKQPAVKMFSDLTHVPAGVKFDLVHFDLAAGNPENIEIFNQLSKNYLNDDAIVVFDDVEIAHPKMLLMFLDIIDNTNYSPVAVGLHKIAVMNRAHKDAFINISNQKGLLDFGAEPFRDKSSEPYKFFLETSNRWGPYLNLRAKT